MKGVLFSVVRGMRGRRRSALLAAAGAAAMVTLVGPALAAAGPRVAPTAHGAPNAAIEPPSLPLPPWPPSLGVALGLVSPTVGTECGSIATAAALVIPGLGASLPVDPVPLAAPVVWVCSAVPPPGKKLNCTLDQQDAALISMLLGPYAIVEAFVNPSVAGPVAQQVSVLQSKLLPGTPVDVAAIVEKGLTCSVEAAPAPVKPPEPPTIDAPSTAPAPTAPPPVEAAPPTALPTADTSAAPAPTPVASAPVTTAPVPAPVLPAPALALASSAGGHDNVDAGVLVGFALIAVGGLVAALKLTRPTDRPPTP